MDLYTSRHLQHRLDLGTHLSAEHRGVALRNTSRLVPAWGLVYEWVHSSSANLALFCLQKASLQTAVFYPGMEELRGDPIHSRLKLCTVLHLFQGKKEKEGAAIRYLTTQ